MKPPPANKLHRKQSPLIFSNSTSSSKLVHRQEWIDDLIAGSKHLLHYTPKSETNPIAIATHNYVKIICTSSIRVFSTTYFKSSASYIQHDFYWYW